MTTFIVKNFKGLLVLSVAILLALFQLVMFDRTIANSPAGFTDELANDTTVYSPLLDSSIFIIILILILAGTYLMSANVKHQWIRITLSVLLTVVAWFVYIGIELEIQGHLSGFMGV